MDYYQVARFRPIVQRLLAINVNLPLADTFYSEDTRDQLFLRLAETDFSGLNEEHIVASDQYRPRNIYEPYGIIRKLICEDLMNLLNLKLFPDQDKDKLEKYSTGPIPRLNRSKGRDCMYVTVLVNKFDKITKDIQVIDDEGMRHDFNMNNRYDYDVGDITQGRLCNFGYRNLFVPGWD